MIIFPKSYEKRVAVIVGTRPNFVKVAPFLKESRNHRRFEFTLIHTGQHFDQNMSQVFFEELGIKKPDIVLPSRGETHTERIAFMLDGLKEVFEHNKFDACVVFGDVNSTLVAALASLKYKCRLVHIESGLRSYDRRMPEEINRVLVDHVSDLLFVSEESGIENLRKEGVKEKKIYLVGNIMIESLLMFAEKINTSSHFEKHGLAKKHYVLVTIHRQENTDSPQFLLKILKIISEINERFPVVFPLHPSTRKKIKEFHLDEMVNGIKTIDPVGYIDFLSLLKNSRGVITDSGGIQEETSYLGIPCCTLRDNTERPITITLGTNKLFPIAEANSTSMVDHLERSDFKTDIIPLWDNKVSERIFKVLNENL